jgi:predicted TIM-barrel enzyme
MEALLKGGPANGETVTVKNQASSIVIDQFTDATQSPISSPADMLYELSSTNDTPVYVFKAFMTLD